MSVLLYTVSGIAYGETRELVIDDQSLWLDIWKRCNPECSPADGIEAFIRLTPQKTGCRAEGRIRGSYFLPCSRCAENVRLEMDASIDVFEPLPEKLGEDRGDCLLERRGQSLVFNLERLLTENFLLELPAKPLCSEGCRGLCVKCGRNLNTEQCTCSVESADPRMSALRGLMLKK